MSSRFDLVSLPLDGTTLIKRKPIDDERGFLERLYCTDEFREAGLAKPIAQINHTLTRKKGAVRGMHFQHPPHAETKVISCLRGKVFDVALDLRPGSATFLRWHGEILSRENRRTLIIPEGFAHGFQTLTDNCEMLYFHTELYAPQTEDGIHPCDETISIDWPETIVELSDRDANLRRLPDDYAGVRV